MPTKPRQNFKNLSSKTARRGASVPAGLFYGAMIVIGLVVAAIILMVGKNAGWFGTKTATVSGTVVYTALKPDQGDEGTVHIYYRDQGSTAEFKDAGIEVPLMNDQSWQWDQAVVNKNYEMQAAVVINGSVVKKSDLQTVTAPASGVDLALKVNWKDLPANVVASSNLAIGGTVSINGYIPARSQLQLLEVDNTTAAGQPLNIGDQLQGKEKAIQTIPNPTASNVWSWGSAVPLKSYVFRAVLKDASGTQIGESEQVINVEAADQQTMLIINSSAQPPVIAQAQPSPSTSAFAALVPTPTPSPVMSPTPAASAVPAAKPSPAPAPAAKVSGTVYLNGPKDKNTSLLMLWKKPGDANYQVVNRYQYPNQAGTAWSLDNAIAGQQYEIQAALQVNGQNTSTAQQPLIVTAPALNVNFTLNTNFFIPSPASQPVFQTCINNSDAVITLPQISNAAQYWVQVGNNNSGDSSFANTKIHVDPNAGDQKITVNVQRGKQSFVRYSFAECVNCSNDNNFSPWSTTVGFTCN